MSLKIDYAEHYNDDYWTGKKVYHDHEGKPKVYHGPSLTWDGFEAISEAISTLVPPSYLVEVPELGRVTKANTMLDIGCGGGDLARRLMKRGFDAYGIDISEHAVKNSVPEMRGRVALADITECPAELRGAGDAFPQQFDFVMSTDLLEHIYEEDLDRTFDWMMSKLKPSGYFFFLIATALPPSAPGFDPNKIGFVHKKGEPVPPEWEATAISGHVNVRPFAWWVKFFGKKGLKVDFQRMYMFQIFREMNPSWRETMGWNMQTTVFLRKP